MTDKSPDAAQLNGETMFCLALELIDKLDSSKVKERLAMLMLFHHTLASGQPLTPESMAKYLDRETLTLMYDLSVSIHQSERYS